MTGESWNKQKLWERYNRSCFCCNEKISKNKCFLRHVQPDKQTRTNEINNFRPLCKTCNGEIGNTNLIEYIVKHNCAGIKNLQRYEISKYAPINENNEEDNKVTDDDDWITAFRKTFGSNVVVTDRYPSPDKPPSKNKLKRFKLRTLQNEKVQCHINNVGIESADWVRGEFGEGTSVNFTMILTDIEYKPGKRYGIQCDWTVDYKIMFDVTLPNGKISIDKYNFIELSFPIPNNPNDIDDYCEQNNDTLVVCSWTWHQQLQMLYGNIWRVFDEGEEDDDDDEDDEDDEDGDNGNDEYINKIAKEIEKISEKIRRK